MACLPSSRTVHGLTLAALMAAPLAHAAVLPPLPANIPVADLPPFVFVPTAQINAWVANDRRDLMKQHAWNLFAAAMAPKYNNAGATVRLFDTWHSLDEAVPPVGAPVVGFGTNQPLTRHVSRLGHIGAATQSVHGLKTNVSRTNLSLSDAVVSDVKYSPAIGRLIENSLTLKTVDAATGQTLVAGYNLNKKTVPGQATAIPFNDTSAVMLKPAFTIIKGKGPTVIARWEESPNVTNPASVSTYTLPVNANRFVGSERTWTKEAVVYPSTSSSWPAPVTYYGRDGTAIATPYNLSSLPKFNLTDFHYVKLNQSQVDSLKTGILSELMGPNIENIEVGDYAVLTSMHIATREIDDWTWQTFWWQPQGGESLAANGASLIVQALMALDPAFKPLKHFRAGVGYSYTNRMGQAVIASNPYLEGSFGLPVDLATVFGPTANTDGVNIFLRDAQDQPLTHNGTSYVHAPAYGLRTNCVTCHRAAAYPTDSLGQLPVGTRGIYPDWGKLQGTEALFLGRVQTHFLWGVPNKISDREAAAIEAGIVLP